MQRLRLGMVLRFASGQTWGFFCSCVFFCHTPQFKMLVFAFRSEVWIAQNFYFAVFEDFCLSLSWKCRFSQNVNLAGVQSKANKWCRFHVDPAGWGLSEGRFWKWGMVPKNCIETPKKLSFRQESNPLPSHAGRISCHWAAGRLEDDSVYCDFMSLLRVPATRP